MMVALQIHGPCDDRMIHYILYRGHYICICWYLTCSRLIHVINQEYFITKHSLGSSDNDSHGHGPWRNMAREDRVAA